jgi:Uma2 family endonuclease
MSTRSSRGSSARIENRPEKRDIAHMNSPVPLTMDKDSFLRWAEGREGHYELVGSRIVMMTGGTRLHAHVTSDLQSVIKQRIDRRFWAVASTDLAVEIDEDIRYPDVVVEPAGADGRAYATANPILVAEVLSASAMALDLNIKAAEYMSPHSLECYIVAAQDEPRLWVWNRAALPERKWPKEPDEVFGKDKSVPVPALGIQIPMAEIYAALGA